MPPEAVPEPILHDKSVRINRGQNRHFEEHASARPALKNCVKKSQQIVIHSDSDDEPKPANIKAKKPPPLPVVVLGEYLINAKTLVGVQAVHRESKSTIVGLWICRHYFDEFARKVERAAKDRGVTPKLISSTATIGYKSMKPSDAIICDVLEPKDWCEVESVVNHLTKSKFNGIHMDLEMKYSSKRNVDDAVDEEHSDNSLSHTDDDIPVIKWAHNVCVK